MEFKDFQDYWDRLGREIAPDDNADPEARYWCAFAAWNAALTCEKAVRFSYSMLPKEGINKETDHE